MSKGNLLIVEDESDIAFLLKNLLSPLANQIFIASNGVEGLEQVEKNEIHAIVCDIAMPQMNGIEFIARMRELNKIHPVIFYTAYGNETLMRQALSYGAYDFINKPNFENLEDVIKIALKEGLELFGKKLKDDVNIPENELEKLILKK